MKIYFGKFALFSGVFTLSLLSGCSSTEPSQEATIANPASEHCIKKGGKIEIVKETAGEKGMCHLPDGTVVEEWALFRRESPQN